VGDFLLRGFYMNARIVAVSILALATAFDVLPANLPVYAAKKQLDTVLCAKKKTPRQQSQDLATLKKLLKNTKLKAMLNKFNPELPLITACEYFWVAGIQELVTAGARFDVIEKETGKNALHALADLRLAEEASEEDCEIIKALIKQQQCNINQKDAHKFTPLLYASAAGCSNMLRMFLDLGANPNVVYEDGDTALHRAVRDEYHDVVALLLLHPDINVYAYNKDERTARDIAYEENNKPAIEMLEKAYKELKDSQLGSYCTSISDMSSSDDDVLLPEIVEQELDVDALYEEYVGSTQIARDLCWLKRFSCQWCTEFLQAAEAGDMTRLSRCFKEGIDVNAIVDDILHWTPLFYAVSRSDVGAVKFLLEHFADPRICDVMGETPLVMLRKMEKSESDEINQARANIEVLLVGYGIQQPM
jgi:ankyrin repeat protein